MLTMTDPPPLLEHEHFPPVEESEERIAKTERTTRIVTIGLLVIVLIVVLAVWRPVLDARDSAEAARDNIEAVRLNNQTNACRATYNNTIIQPKLDRQYQTVVDLVRLNVSIDLATRGGVQALISALTREFAQTQATLAQTQTDLANARSAYQEKIRQSGAHPATFVAACKRSGLLDHSS